MACLRGSVPCVTIIVVLHDSRASYICILLVISFLTKLACVVLRNWLSNVARELQKCQTFAYFLYLSANPEFSLLAAPMLPDVYGSNILLEFKIC